MLSTGWIDRTLFGTGNQCLQLQCRAKEPDGTVGLRSVESHGCVCSRQVSFAERLPSGVSSRGIGRPSAAPIERHEALAKATGIPG